MSEAIESIAILRTSTGHDLRTDQVSDEKILKCCLSLVRHAPKISDGRNVGLLRLSHSAVRTFLLEDAGTILTAGTEHKHAVESWIIRDSCLKYLSQPRYRELLVKRSSALFKTQDGDNVLSHQFLLYAAKYWFRHFDLPHESKDAALDEGDRATVTKFLRSPNFVTIMQVQSLFIAGYFLQSFDPITDRGVSVRRTLPNWVQQHEPDLHRQYQAFQGQWCRILQSSLFESFRGEIDRCFWGALGPESFLSSQTHRKARYNSFEFSKGSKSEYDSCQVHHVSQDGQRLVTGWIRTEG
jgi:hypothetical protein